jgi:hypothetical protein
MHQNHIADEPADPARSANTGKNCRACVSARRPALRATHRHL